MKLKPSSQRLVSRTTQYALISLPIPFDSSQKDTSISQPLLFRHIVETKSNDKYSFGFSSTELVKEAFLNPGISVIHVT